MKILMNMHVHFVNNLQTLFYPRYKKFKVYSKLKLIISKARMFKLKTNSIKTSCLILENKRTHGQTLH